MCSPQQGHERGSRRNEERAAPLAEHLKCAPRQDVTEMCANCFNPSHLLAPCNGPPAIPPQIKIHLPLARYRHYCISFRFNDGGNSESRTMMRFGQQPAHTFSLKITCTVCFVLFFITTAKEVMFSMSICWLDCQQDYTKTTEQISTKLGWGTSLGPQ